MATKFIVEAPNNWFLRGRVFAGTKERAERFPSREAAQERIDSLVTDIPYHKKKTTKTWRIVPEEIEDHV